MAIKSLKSIKNSSTPDLSALERFSRDVDNVPANTAANETTTKKPKPAEPSVVHKRKIAFPWEEARPDVIKKINIDLPEEYMLKLTWLIGRIPESKRGFISKVAMKEIDKSVAREQKKG